MSERSSVEQVCVALTIDLIEMNALGAIDLQRWPNAQLLVEAFGGVGRE